jgi:glycosyltransferase involved in cell wall biosynthesis
MAMVRPVVGTRVEGTAEEVVDGETGILVEPRDAEGLAHAVLTLLRDPELRDRMGRAGRARVEKLYTLSRTADLIQGVYQDALIGRAG